MVWCLDMYPDESGFGFLSRREDRAYWPHSVRFGKSWKEAHMPLLSCKTGEEPAKRAHVFNMLWFLRSRRGAHMRSSFSYFRKKEEERT